MSQNTGQPTRTRGNIARSRRSGSHENAYSALGRRPYSGRVRMMTRVLAVSTLLTVALGGAVFASSDAGQPAKCKVVSVQTQTQVRAGGIMHRTETTSRCRGEKVVTYTAWS